MNFSRKEKKIEFQNVELKYRLSFSGEGKNLPLLILLNDSGSGMSFEIPEAIRQENPVILSLDCNRDSLRKYGWKLTDYHFRKDPVPPVAALLKLLDSILREYPVDFSRLYLAGIAAGGFVCWELMRRRIGLFAGAILVGCGTDLADFSPVAATPIRLYHGVEDPVVPIRIARQLYLMLMDIHCDVKLNEIPGSDRDALLHVSGTSEPMQWLFGLRQKIFTSMPLPENFRIVELDAFGFTAKILPDAAGNIFSLRHKTTGTALLREPHRPEELFHTPERFGIPPLFPPNRIEDGSFLFDGKICRLPINQPVQNLHLHGIAVSKPWQLIRKDENFAELKFTFDSDSPEYDGFPFACEIVRRYELTEKGLRDIVTVRNTGDRTMPLGLGFHTAFPAENATVRVGTGEYEFEIHKTTFLPTGHCLPWNEFDPRNAFDPFKKIVSFHSEAGYLQSVGGCEFHGAELVYPTGTLRYITDEKFGFWYTWNAGGLNNFLCLEPVSWMSNALNLPLPASRSGVRKLAPGEESCFVSLLEFEPGNTSEE